MQQELFLGIKATATSVQRLQTWLDTQEKPTQEKPAAALLCFGDYGAHADVVPALLAMTQAQNIAFLLLDDVERALSLGADGVHLSDKNRFDTTRRALNAAAGENPPSLGLFGSQDRHETMLIGEKEPDYLFFGALEGGGTEADREAITLANWWADLFEIPCVCAGNSRAEFKYQLLD